MEIIFSLEARRSARRVSCFPAAIAADGSAIRAASAAPAQAEERKSLRWTVESSVDAAPTDGAEKEKASDCDRGDRSRAAAIERIWNFPCIVEIDRPEKAASGE